MDIQSRFVNALRTQAAKEPTRESRPTGALPCPYLSQCQGRMFQNAEQLLGHVRSDHREDYEGLESPKAREKLINAVKELR